MLSGAREQRRLFAAGMVDGYFGGNIPMEFWKLLAFYICSNTLGSLPWAMPFGEGQIQVMRKQAAQVLEWYDGMRMWYRLGTTADKRTRREE